MVGFLFGGETGVESPQELARKRAQIAAMQGQVASANPRSFGEGLTAIGRALASRISDRQIGAREEEERARAGSAFSQIAGQLGGGGYGGGYSRPAPVSAAVPPVTSSPISTPNTAGLPQGIVDAVDRVNPLQPHPVAPAQPVSMPAGNAPENWEQIRNGIFAGESNGDYNALFGFSNRDGGPFSDVQLTDMTVDQALNFAAPSGPYGQWVRDQVGHVATPMGGYQIVGTTLRAAKEGLGLTGNEQMTPELQDLLGQWIYRAQGTDAWEGYRGPQSGAPSGGGSFSGGGSGGGGMSGGGMNPQIIAQLAELASNPYLPEGQRMIAQQLIQTQLQGMDPMRQLEMQRAQMEIEAMRNPQADNFRPTTPEEAAMYGGFGQMGPDGRFYPLADSPLVNIDQRDGMGPDDSELRDTLMKAEGDLWAGYLGTGNQAAGALQDLDMMEQLLQMAPQGPITGGLAQRFPQFDSAAGAFQSIVLRVAPTLRAEGSGATSDIEYNGMLNSLPRLQNNPEANIAIIGMMRAKAQINQQRAAVVQQYQNGGMSAQDARTAIAAIDSQSIMTPELERILNAVGGDEGQPDAATPPAQGAAVLDISTMTASEIAAALPSLSGADRDAALARLRQIAGQ